MQRAALLLCLGAWAALGQDVPAAAMADLSPVTRIVELLKGLKMQCEEEAKVDEKMYDKFVCWGKQVIMQKTDSNEVASKEIAELEQYIADLDAGRIELTTERVDLEKEIAETTQTIEIATDQRNKENADYENAVAEMTQAIDALDKAVEVLKTATEGHEQGVLTEIKTEAGHRAEAEAKETAVMKHAVELSQRFLSKGDALFMRRLLTGEVPEWDWKKLNRKATFKMSYKARSFKIQDVLDKLLETFKTNKQEAIDKETEAKKLYDTLMEEKNKQLDAARDALAKMEKENGARALSKTDAQERIDILKEQVKNDEGYIKQVKDELAYKRKEWDERSKLRYGEIEAIAKAIQILHNDDARDLFKRSLSSQGYLFLQTGASRMQTQGRDAASVLRLAAAKSNDRRLAALASLLAEPDFGSLSPRFQPIIDKIDELVKIINSEEASDLKKKETCEEERAINTRKAIELSREIDEFSDTISRLVSEVEKLDEQIKENEEAIEVLKQQMAEATEQRKEENEVYKKEKADDKLAAETVQSAYDVLEKFYKENGLMSLVQSKQPEITPVVVEAGKAPPPPPTTWDAPYGGKTDEGVGILAILSMIKEDIERDMAKCDAEEKEAVATYDSLMTKLNKEKGEREQDITDMEGEKAGKLGEKNQAELDRKTKKGGLDTVLALIADLEPGCNYYTVLFNVRVKNRQIEVDGLLKAKAILQGAKFDAPDPDRELKVGDALLQQEKLAAVRKH
jgi:chromosome segregation ATPase